MANAQTEVRVIEFSIEEEKTTCNLFYTSSEPDNPFWGGGWKNKSFGKEISIVDFINLHASDYLHWENGRIQTQAALSAFLQAKQDSPFSFVGGQEERTVLGQR